jgi:hypothetical protein
MDQQTVQQNEKVLGKLLDKGDKKFVSLVGITALGLLTEQMPPEQYAAFLATCIDNASEIQKHKNLNTKNVDDGDEAEEQSQAPAPVVAGGA